MSDEKLSDNQVWDRLHAAREALGQAEGSTVAGDTAMTTARRALLLLQMGVLKSSEPDQVTAPAETSPGPIPDPQ